jgi:RNA polymerase sigma factor (sigma-70 family)
MSASPVLETPSDHELASAYRAGDERAAAELVRRHAPALGRYLYSSGAAPDEIEDLVQEALFRAFRRLDGWRGEASFRSWLFAIAGNVLRDEFRRRKGRQVLPILRPSLPRRRPRKGCAAGSRRCRDSSARSSSFAPSRGRDTPRSPRPWAPRPVRHECTTITRSNA